MSPLNRLDLAIKGGIFQGSAFDSLYCFDVIS